MYKMIKLLVSFIILLPTCSAWGFPTESISIQPVHADIRPETNNLQILDTDLQNELINLSQQRNQYHEQLHIEYLPFEDRPAQFDNSTIVKRLMDKSASRFLKSRFFKKSSLGKTAKTVEESVQTDVEFKDERNMEHKFDFKLKIFRDTVYIRYQGFTQARLRYNYALNTFALTFDHTLSENGTISIDTTIGNDGRPYQQVALNFWW